MTENTAVTALAELLTDTGHAHHHAFEATDGADPEWPLWYAQYLEPKIAGHLDSQPTRSRLVQCLLNADEYHAATGRAEPWPRVYARFLLGLAADDMPLADSPERA